MEELSDKSTDSLNISRQIFKDLSELNKLKEEKESLFRTNSIYLAQVAEMEVKISELQAQLQAKDSELDRYRKTQDSTESSRNYSELESKVAWLEEENNSLKEYSSLIGDLTQLKIQLEHANNMKAKFEQLYREAKVRLIEFENESNLFTCNEKLAQEKDDMEKELFNLQLRFRSQEIQLSKANEENRNLKQLLAARDRELYELYNKLDSRSESIAKSEPLTKHRSAKDLQEFIPKFAFTKPQASSINRSPKTQTISTTKRESEESTNEIMFSKTLGNDLFSKHFKQALRSTPSSISDTKDTRTPISYKTTANCSTTSSRSEKHIAAFVPSIMRVKKLFKQIDTQDKPYIQKHHAPSLSKDLDTHSIRKISENSFADEFPEEDELL
jgi:chromosome segregation ATPase